MEWAILARSPGLQLVPRAELQTRGLAQGFHRSRGGPHLAVTPVAEAPFLPTPQLHPEMALPNAELGPEPPRGLFPTLSPSSVAASASDLDLPGPSSASLCLAYATTEEVMRDPVSSQYSSFLFWRMPIPELDLSELESLGLSDTSTYKVKDSSGGKTIGQATAAELEKNPEGDALLEYSTFNFWRAPIASVRSFELDLL